MRGSLCQRPGDSRGPWTAVYDRLVLNRPMLRGLFVALTLSVAACGGSSSSVPTVNASGEYSGSVTNGANSCPGLWNMGETNVLNMTVTQTDQGSVALQLKGAYGLAVQLILGSSTLTGTVNGTAINAVFIGTNRITDASSGCSFIWSGDFNASLSGDSLSGTMQLRPQMVSGTSCDAFTACSREVAVNETRAH